jgi:hypothetical protein
VRSRVSFETQAPDRTILDYTTAPLPTTNNNILHLTPARLLSFPIFSAVILPFVHIWTAPVYHRRGKACAISSMLPSHNPLYPTSPANMLAYTSIFITDVCAIQTLDWALITPTCSRGVPSPPPCPSRSCIVTCPRVR